MKSENRLFSYFTVLALLFWNPLMLWIFYRNTSVYDLKLIHVFYWLVFLAGTLVTWLTLRNKLGNRAKNLALFFSYTGIAFAFLATIDKVISPGKNTSAGKPGTKETGLLFEPNSHLAHQTFEFTYTALINSIGLRNKEIADKKGRFRVLCFGDSWTYGWGVDGENTWPAKLEDYLHRQGFTQAEVINCGQPGHYTTMYKQNMERIIPALKPDLVLAGVLQFDDLLQLYECNKTFSQAKHANRTEAGFFEKIKFAAVTYLQVSFKNMLSLINNPDRPVVYDAREMAPACQQMIAHFDYLQNMRYQSLDDTIQLLFGNGQLNPGLLRYYVGFPDAARIFNDPAHPFTKMAAKSMSDDIKEMKRICDRNRCGLVFVNLPYNIFSGHRVERTPEDFMNPYFENNNHIDSIYEAVAATQRLPYISLTGRFRSLPDKTGYFFRFDGHPTKKGYAEMAQGIAEQLAIQHLLAE